LPMSPSLDFATWDSHFIRTNFWGAGQGGFKSKDQYAKGQTLAVKVTSLKPLGDKEDKGDLPCRFKVNGKEYTAEKRDQIIFVNLEKDGPVVISVGLGAPPEFANRNTSELRFGYYENSAKTARWILCVQVSLK